MEIPVSAQALTFAQGVLLGLGLCLAYDLLRALRRLFPQTGFAADALFGLLLTASFLSFALTAGADFADAARAAALFLEISQKNFKNPLCKFPKMGYNDL